MNLVWLVIQLIVAWSTFFFAPLVLLLCCYPSTRNLLVQLYEAVGLLPIYRTIKDQVKEHWKQLLRIVQACFLSKFRTRRAQFGYALLKENGRYLRSASKDVFCYQLYDYLARSIDDLMQNFCTFRCSAAKQSSRWTVARSEASNTSPRILEVPNALRLTATKQQ